VIAAAFVLEHQCPQCGAPVILEEVDRFFLCPYCHAKHYIFTKGYFRYYLPPLHNIGNDVVYMPYWRFKGMKIEIIGNVIKRDIIDRSFCSAPDTGIPFSLGFRSQTLTMKFLQPDTPGRLIPSTIPLRVFLKTLEKKPLTDFSFTVSGKPRIGESINETLIHSTIIPDLLLSEMQETVISLFIGEIVSLIYAPVFVKNRMLYDGISGMELGSESKLSGSFPAVIAKKDAIAENGEDSCESEGAIAFFPALCPQCGWELQGDKESYVMVCPQCCCAWKPSESGLTAVEFFISFSLPKADLWVPFWRMSADCSNAMLSSMADFYRLTSFPRPIAALDEQRPFFFWIPAFKSNPELYLRLGRIFIVQQREIEKPSIVPSPLYPVTLPESEAFQGIPAFLAELSTVKKKIIPLIKNAAFSMKSFSLVFVPFVDRGSEFIQPECTIAINKNALRLGREL
jgi:hypothetical protein